MQEDIGGLLSASTSPGFARLHGGALRAASGRGLGRAQCDAQILETSAVFHKSPRRALSETRSELLALFQNVSEQPRQCMWLMSATVCS